MRIVIDLQCAQSDATRFRGIGRYAVSLTQALLRSKEPHDILIILNSAFKKTIEPIKESFDGLLPKENILIWHAPFALLNGYVENPWRIAVKKRIREAFIADLNPDILHVPSFFQGFDEDVVTSIGDLNQNMPTVVTLYDLIPLMMPEMYLTCDKFKAFYLEKIESFKKADAWLSISDFSTKICCETLNIAPSWISTTQLGCEDVFKKIKFPEFQKDMLLKQYGIHRPFVLYVGGGDARKNLNQLINAYALLDIRIRQTHQLVITGKLYPVEIEKLQACLLSTELSFDDLILTGYVDDQQLAQLYNLCQVLVLPSLYEGFGLPALEAMACGAAVIASNTTSLPEVIGREEALFDPNSAESIAALLSRVLTDEPWRASLSLHGLEQSKKFSWDNAARIAIEMFQKVHEDQKKNRISFSARDSHENLELLLSSIAALGVRGTAQERICIADAISKNMESAHLVKNAVS